MGSSKHASIRIRIDGTALDRLNQFSNQFRLSRTQLVALLAESATEEHIAQMLLNQTQQGNEQKVNSWE